MKQPDWLKVKFNIRKTQEVSNILHNLQLNTVCEEASCPNKVECFGKKTATFMILGRKCTRNCTFCNVEKYQPSKVDIEEPLHVAQAVKDMGMKHVVITSVTRDDLSDGGAGHFEKVIKAIQELDLGVTIEVLIPDFQGNMDALNTVARAKPEIINHNLETISRLYTVVRPMARYQQSLDLLYNAKRLSDKIITKSGIMLGLGEKRDEVLMLMENLRKVDCDILTIGQYLAPSTKHYPIMEYIHPDIFEQYKEEGLSLGFKYVASSPFVRSSYNAFEALDTILNKGSIRF